MHTKTHSLTGCGSGPRKGGQQLLPLTMQGNRVAEPRTQRRKRMTHPDCVTAVAGGPWGQPACGESCSDSATGTEWLFPVAAISFTH